MSFLISGSSYRRPIRRLVAYRVFWEFVTACRLAGAPTILSPSDVNATTDGVVRAPSLFSSTFGLLPSITETHEFVVPRSMPMTWPFTLSDLQRQITQTISAIRRVYTSNIGRITHSAVELWSNPIWNLDNSSLPSHNDSHCRNVLI